MDLQPQALQFHSPRFATRAVRVVGEGTKNVMRRLSEKRHDNDVAAASLANIGAGALVVVAAIIGAVVGMKVLAQLFPTYSSSAGALAENFSTADWGDDTANSISPTMGMVVALGALFSVLGLAFIVYKLRS